jgi:RsmE family RNA methyltransferase
MNTLIVFENEIDNNTILFEGKRAQLYAKSLAVNQNIRLALLGKFCARGQVKLSSTEKVLIEIKEIIGAPERLNVSLFVAVPRPQTVKKVISLAAQVGIESLYFVRSYQTVPSYLQSKSLKNDMIQDEIIKALEQVWDSVPPKIEVLDSMKSLFTPILSEWKHAHKNNLLLLAEPQSEVTVSINKLIKNPTSDLSVMLGIGPEKGWTAGEINQFLELGFKFVHLNKREYRVETALALLLGQLQLLLELHS